MMLFNYCKNLDMHMGVDLPPPSYAARRGAFFNLTFLYCCPAAIRWASNRVFARQFSAGFLSFLWLQFAYLLTVCDLKVFIGASYRFVYLSFETIWFLRCMGGSGSTSKPKTSLLILGLDNSGKTTIINSLLPQGQKDIDIVPTIGFAVQRIRFPGSGITASCIDMSGSSKYRDLWSKYFR